MRRQRTIRVAAVGAALALFAGVAAVRQEVPSPRLNVDSLASELGLSAEARDQLAPRIDELNALLARREQALQQGTSLRTELQEVEGAIAQVLTPEQQRQFGFALHRAWGHGHGMGFVGGPMGMTSGGHMGRHMGIGYMGGGSMGGHWMHGGAMGGGHGGHGFMRGGSMSGPRGIMGSGGRGGN